MKVKKDIFSVINLSEVLGYMFILPPSTATRSAIEVLKNYPFGSYFVHENKLIYLNDGPTHSHCNKLFDGHEKYKLIMTCKNPYSKWVSRYRLDMINEKQVKSSFDIKNSFYEHVLDQVYVYDLKNILKGTELKFSRMDKNVSHFIRTENILEDYRSIPFIGGSELDKSGKLEEILNNPVGKFPKKAKISWKLPEDWRDYYTQETADLVFGLFKQDFEFYGYDRNSWKK